MRRRRPSSRIFLCAWIVAFLNSAFREDGTNYRHSEGRQRDNARQPERMHEAVRVPLFQHDYLASAKYQCQFI